MFAPRPLLALLAAAPLAACSRPARPAAAAGATDAAGAEERIRPPPPPCLEGAPGEGTGLLARAAQDALDRGDAARALACAEEGIRADPRHRSALVARAAALDALDRIDDARLAWERALAVDPDAPEALLGAALFHVQRLGGDREAVEVAREQALRGLAVVARRGPRDRALEGRLLVAAAMAENELGRSDLALPRVERATRLLPGAADAAYERALALFELCRFPAAEAAFQRVLELEPDDPWALHHLGLVAERRGDARRAADLLDRARALAPGDFPPEVAVDAAAFDAQVRRTLAALPEAERRALAGVPVEVADLPDAADLTAVEPPLSPTILGLFRGPSEGEPCLPEDGPVCRSIVLYRKNLARATRDRPELDEQVRVTLLHELGHLHGEDDDALRRRGLE